MTCSCGAEQTPEEAAKGEGEYDSKWGRRYICLKCWCYLNETKSPATKLIVPIGDKYQ